MRFRQGRQAEGSQAALVRMPNAPVVPARRDLEFCRGNILPDVRAAFPNILLQRQRPQPAVKVYGERDRCERSEEGTHGIGFQSLRQQDAVNNE